MNKHYSIINGELVSKDEAALHLSDLAIQRGYGIFDFFLTRNGTPAFLEDHLTRLLNSAKKMRLDSGISRDGVREMILRLIDKNKMNDSGIKVTVTGGYAEDGYTISEPNLIITQSEFRIVPETFEKGINLITYNHQRQLPDVKTIDYLMAIYLKPLIREKHADDVLYVSDGEVRECPRANFFIVDENKKILTADKKILGGITRKNILAMSGFEVEERAVSVDSVYKAREAFISSSTKRVLPVLSVDGKTIGSGKPGEVTAALYEALSKVH